MTLVTPPSAEEQARTPLLALLLAVTFAMAFPLGYAWDLGFSGLAALAGALSIVALSRRRPAIWIMVPLILLVGWALISLRWSPAAVDPHALRRYADIEKLTGAKLVLQIGLYGALVAAALRISSQGAEIALTALSSALAALGVVTLLDALQHAHLYLALSAHVFHSFVRPDLGLRNIAVADYVIALFIWCAAVRLYHMGLPALTLVIVACALAISLVLNSVDATRAALGLGLLAFLLVRAGGMPGVALLSAVTAVYWMGAPLIALTAADHGLLAALHSSAHASWNARLDIWGFAAAKIAQRPWIGWGLDSSRLFGASIPLHPHDAALQIWLELGFVGAVLMATAWALIWAYVEALGRRDRTAAAAAAATATAYLTIGAMSFGVWQEWWLALGALAAAACVCLDRARGFVEILRPNELTPL